MSHPPLASLNRRDAERIVSQAVENGRLERAPAERLGAALADVSVLEAVLEGASESKRRGKGDIVSVSRNVFIPLTNLCRNRCAYCSFAKPPDSGEAKSYTLDEVADLVRGGLRTGCVEVLLCLGDKPELAHPSHRRWLKARGVETTAAYLVEACRVAFEAGMLPHANAGILRAEEMEKLRRWCPSLGLMLESTSQRLRGRGMAHHQAPDKEPAARIRMHEEAGQIGIPFTSGILLGIGEHSEERVDALLSIRDLAARYGHIQEVIVQAFHPKPATAMRAASPLPAPEVAGWVALARLILGPEMNLQSPPNLEPDALGLLLRSGLNDWGGVSPVTVDLVNPEAPWPTFRELERRTQAAGQRLVERLPVYPEYLLRRPELFDLRVRRAALQHADETGYARPHGSRARVEAA